LTDVFRISETTPNLVELELRIEITSLENREIVYPMEQTFITRIRFKQQLNWMNGQELIQINERIRSTILIWIIPRRILEFISESQEIETSCIAMPKSETRLPMISLLKIWFQSDFFPYRDFQQQFLFPYPDSDLNFLIQMKWIWWDMPWSDVNNLENLWMIFHEFELNL
jgi:hypothetical protein